MLYASHIKGGITYPVTYIRFHQGGAASIRTRIQDQIRPAQNRTQTAAVQAQNSLKYRRKIIQKAKAYPENVKTNGDWVETKRVYYFFMSVEISI